MTDHNAEIIVDIKADTRELKKEISDMEKMSQEFGKTILGAFKGAIQEGKRFSDVLRGLALDFSGKLFDVAMKPLQGLVGTGLNHVLKGLLPFAKGGVIAQSGVVPFAAGGVIATPTYFPLSGGRLGVMGEAGAEAIMPLARGSDGRLGVRASGAARGPASVSVVVNTPDIESFSRSEAEITAMMARVLRRGRRGL